MPRFRKKPVEIEARQLTAASREEVADWIEQGGQQAVPNAAGLVIPTLEGDHLAGLGDWIIRGVQGEFYPCRSDIFEATYEPVNGRPRSRVELEAAAAALAEAFDPEKVNGSLRSFLERLAAEAATEDGEPS